MLAVVVRTGASAASPGGHGAAGDAKATAAARLARLQKLLAGLGERPRGSALWLLHCPQTTAMAHADFAAAVRAWAPDARLLPHAPGADMAALVQAAASHGLPWTLVLDACVQPLTGLVATYMARLQPRPSAHLGLLVGCTERSLAGEPSPLQHFLAAQQQRRFLPLADGACVPADWVPDTNLLVHTPQLLAPRLALPALCWGAQITHLCRSLYAQGAQLHRCRGARVRRTAPASVASAVAHWRAWGRDAWTLMQAHRDPHGHSRVQKALGPYGALRTQGPELLLQLQNIEVRLQALPRPARAAIRELQPSYHNLYAISVLEGMRSWPQARALWPEPQTVPGAAVPAQAGGPPCSASSI